MSSADNLPDQVLQYGWSILESTVRHSDTGDADINWRKIADLIIYLFICVFIQYLKRCTLLAEIAILPSGPL